MHDRPDTRGASPRQPPAPDAPAARALVILPTYNESENLADIVAAIRAQGDFGVLIIDDGSPDGTGAIADALADADRAIRVIHRERKLGLGSAYRRGFRAAIAAGYDYAIEMDADFQHDPEDLPRLVAAMASHASGAHGAGAKLPGAWLPGNSRRDATPALVIGSRYVPGGRIPDWPLGRRLISSGGNLIARLALGGRPHDYTGGFRCYRTEALARLDLDRVTSTGYGFQIEMVAALKFSGARIAELPIAFHDRRAGTSKMHWKIALEALVLVGRLMLRRFVARAYYCGYRGAAGRA